MRFSRLLSLFGVVVAAAGLYLPSVDTDAELIASIAGTPVPDVWEAAERGAQVVALALLVGIVALAFRPRRGRGLRRLAGAGIAVLTAPAGLYLVFAYRDARAAASGLTDSLDLAVFSGLITDSPGATGGIGHLITLAGLLVVAVGGALEVVAPGAVPPRRADAPGVFDTGEAKGDDHDDHRGEAGPTGPQAEPESADEANHPEAEPAPDGEPRSASPKPDPSASRPTPTLETGAATTVHGGIGGGDTSTGGSGSRYEPGG